jgi:hypothetical protein
MQPELVSNDEFTHHGSAGFFVFCCGCHEYSLRKRLNYPGFQ